MKKSILSLFMIAAVGAAVIGATTAFFSDVEESKGNIFTAGSIDLKVDHTAQAYNGVDCKTCSVLLTSDPTNMVAAKNGAPFAVPYPAVFLNPIHPAWTAQNEPSLLAAGAKWIWEQNPVKAEDTTVDVTYTFEKTFEWWGPITGTDLAMAVGHDNTVDVYLNGTLIGQGTNIYGFQQENMLHIPAANIISNTAQGLNVLKFVVMNKGQANGNPSINPAGLIYKFEINGNCEDDYFKTHCRLWGLKDLAAGDKFWNFEDIKPGDWGNNKISLHVYDNDAWVCLYAANQEDIENDLTDPETKAPVPDTTPEIGELSKYLRVIVWHDVNEDGMHQISEPILYDGLLSGLMTEKLALATAGTSYLGMEWCAGVQAIDGTSGAITCDGSGNQDDAQTDAFLADLVFYAVQQRHNPDFSCADFIPGPEDNNNQID